MQVDTDASFNVIPAKYLPPGTLVNMTDRTVRKYNKSIMPVLGTCKLSMCRSKNRKKYEAEFVVVKGDYTPLIASRASQQMNLIKVQHENILLVYEQLELSNELPDLTCELIMNEFSDVFKGQGHMKRKLYLEVDAFATPVIMPLRRVLIALKERLKDELVRLVGINMIRKVEEPTVWVSSLVVVEKPNGKLSLHRCHLSEQSIKEKPLSLTSY